MTFKPGDKVRVKDSELDSYKTEFQRKIKGRVGVINSVEHGDWKYHDRPFVIFPAEGRKKEYRAGQINARNLELIELGSN
ncbi:hypothetical protein [Azotobacter salinestris]|uniref:hypothetical protein n=1 Tax=Azotobacter salinestris TaxID=69964 RepID=UPI0032DFCE12